MAQVTDKSFLTLAVTLGMTLLVFSPVSICFWGLQWAPY
jgi:hypothetical protein